MGETPPRSETVIQTTSSRIRLIRRLIRTSEPAEPVRSPAEVPVTGVLPIAGSGRCSMGAG